MSIDAPTPIPTIHDPAYFARLAEVEFVHWWSAGMWRIAAHWLDRRLRGRSGLRALDVGCGTGGPLVRLADRPEIADVIGLDPSPSALGLARRRCDPDCVCADAPRPALRGRLVRRRHLLRRLAAPPRRMRSLRPPRSCARPPTRRAWP